MKKKLITGLGNPGEKYKKTRHNAGFFVVNELERQLREDSISPDKVGTSRVTTNGQNTGQASINRSHSGGIPTPTGWRARMTIEPTFGGLFLLKPQTGMNSSGKAVKRGVEKRGIDLDNLLVIHDDLDIELGKYKLQKGRGTAGHNGVQSVIDSLGSKDFWRLRIGIGRPPANADPTEYVLEDFTKNELRILGGLIEDELIPIIMEWLSDE